MALCAACDEHNPARARFCLSCGTPFAEAAVAVQVREVRKVVTVVFCDLTGSTELGERLDAEPLRALLDLYFSTMSEVLHRHGGTVEKFIGDAVVAVFGVPALHEDDALRAVRAATEMAGAMGRLGADLDRQWGVRPNVRIGVNTGEVLAGDATGRERLATGDAVNVAARLEQAAAPGQVLVGQATYRLVRDAVRAEAVPPLRLKGKAEPEPAFLVQEVLAGAKGYARRLDTPLVGRERELAALRDEYEQAVTSRSCRRAFVTGTAGIGKSRLVAELLTGLGGRATVLSGACLPYGRGITFWPIREMLRTVGGWTPDDSVEVASGRIADLLPGEPDSDVVAERLASLVGLGTSAGRIEEGFWAVRRLLEALSRWRPVVMVTDDLQWAEPALLDLLDDVLRTAGPVLLVCGARPELFDDHPGWHAEDVRVALEPLPDDLCDRLIDSVLGSSTVEPMIRAHVRASAEGNPLFVEELLATFREDGILLHRSTGWVASRPIAPQLIPSSIEALLRARLERLTGEQQAYIEVAAVVGRVFWQTAVAELAREIVGGRAADHLTELVTRDLITPDVSVFVGDHAFRFRHILLRDAAYSALPKAARAEAHEQFSDWLTRAVGGERAAEYDEIVGYHLERAFELRSALAPVGERERELAGRGGARLAAAGTRSFVSGDIAAAVNLLARAHALLTVDPPARLRLVPTLCLAMSWRGDPKGASALLAASIAESEPLDDAGLTMHLQLAMAAGRDGEDSPTLQERAAQDAVAVFTETGDDEGLARAWMLMGLAQTAQGRTTAAEASWTQALPPARRAAPELAEETEIWLASYCVYGQTHVDEVATRLDRLGNKIGGKPYREGTLLRGRAFVAAMREDYPSAYRLLARSRETYDDLGLSFPKALASQTAYEVALRAGELGSAIPSLEEDEAALAGMGDQWARSTTTAMLAHAMYADGRLEAAQRWGEVARDLTTSGDVLSEVLWRTVLAKLLARSGGHEEARALALEAVTLVRSSDWLCIRADALLDQAEVLTLGGRTQDAVAVVGQARELYAQKGDGASVVRSDRVLGHIG